MAADEEILKSNGDWTKLRHQICAVIARRFSKYQVVAEGDYILVCSGDQPWVLVEQIGLGMYRTKVNGAGNPGDPRKIVGGGKDVAADELLQQIGRDISLIEDRRIKHPSS